MSNTEKKKYSIDEIRRGYVELTGLIRDGSQDVDRQMLHVLYSMLSYYFEEVYSKTQQYDVCIKVIRKWLKIFYSVSSTVTFEGMKIISPYVMAALDRLDEEMKQAVKEACNG